MRCICANFRNARSNDHAIAPIKTLAAHKVRQGADLLRSAPLRSVPLSAPVNSAARSRTLQSMSRGVLSVSVAMATPPPFRPLSRAQERWGEGSVPAPRRAPLPPQLRTLTVRRSPACLMVGQVERVVGLSTSPSSRIMGFQLPAPVLHTTTTLASSRRILPCRPRRSGSAPRPVDRSYPTSYANHVTAATKAMQAR